MAEYSKDIPLGWLSPDGCFEISDWGTHTTEAERIIEKRGWYRDYAEHEFLNARDYLSGRGYCLIHDPGKFHPIASHIVPLTRRQREFLWAYFSELGDKESARKYLEEEF